MDKSSKPGRRRSLDHFRGAERLLELSLRLMDWYGEPVTDEEVASALGPEIVPAFRYAERRLAGKIRNVTLEPAFCHSADVAFRAAGLGYSSSTLIVCLLHDVVEDTSDTIADVPGALDDLAARFAPPVVGSASLLTNRYQLIFRGLVPKVRRDVPFDTRARLAYRAALDVLRFELPRHTTDPFEPEFDRLAEFLESRADLSLGEKIARRDKKFTVATYLERQVYHLYIEDMVARAAEETREGVGGEGVTALVVKLIDLTDNIRTTEVSNRLSLFKLMNKVEAVLDRTLEGLLAELPASLTRPTAIPALHRLVQLRLVDQLEARRRAVADNFAETRFAGLVDFLAHQIARLMEKYGVPRVYSAEIPRLEDVVRRTNTAGANHAE